MKPFLRSPAWEPLVYDGFLQICLLNCVCIFVCVLRGTEEVFQVLEDNQVTLSVMKASRFAKAFEKEVDHWERCLSLVLEVIEMILTVQRQWMYLEVRTHTHSTSYSFI